MDSVTVTQVMETTRRPHPSLRLPGFPPWSLLGSSVVRPGALVGPIKWTPAPSTRLASLASTQKLLGWRIPCRSFLRLS